MSSLRAAHVISMTGKRPRGTPTFPLHESYEAWRLLGSLEWLDVPVKVQLGDMIVDLLPKRKFEKVRGPMVWALGRLGQRQPLYGPLNTVVPIAAAVPWCEAILRLEVGVVESPLAMMQLCRRTHDRYRDPDEPLRERVANWLHEAEAPPHLLQLVREGGTLASEERDQVFGETLPKGLRIMSEFGLSARSADIIDIVDLTFVLGWPERTRTRGRPCCDSLVPFLVTN